MAKRKRVDLEMLGGSLVPTRTGVYLAKGIWGDNEAGEIDVYSHWKKGLCCFSEDFGSGGTGVDDRYDCHVSVQFTGLEFIERVRNLDR
jgi:hypothetical protein